MTTLAGIMIEDMMDKTFYNNYISEMISCVLILMAIFRIFGKLNRIINKKFLQLFTISIFILGFNYSLLGHDINKTSDDNKKEINLVSNLSVAPKKSYRANSLNYRRSNKSIRGRSKFVLIDEYIFSVNYFGATYKRSSYTENSIKSFQGFGIGVYHSFFRNHKLNIMLGLVDENNTIKRKNIIDYPIYNGRFTEPYDVTNISSVYNSLHIPLGVRFNIGRRIKIFTELGIYIDGIIYSDDRYTTTFYPASSSNPQTHLFHQADWVWLGGHEYVGEYFGFGLKIPAKRYDIIIKPEYRISSANMARIPNFMSINEAAVRSVSLNVGFRIK